MITAIIVDDEQKNVSLLTTLTREYCPQVALIGTANNATDGIKLVRDLSPELIFLDIEMPFGSGFDMLHELPDLKSEIIFITAFDQYAVNAFRYSATDYLLKPLLIEHLTEAVKRVEKRIKEKGGMEKYEVLLKNINEKDLLKHTIVLSDRSHQQQVRLSDIKYIIADGSYCHIYTTARTYISTKKLRDYEEMLPQEFFCRIHHGHIINKNFVEKMQKGRGGNVHMSDGKILEIAVRRKDDFLKMYL